MVSNTLRAIIAAGVMATGAQAYAAQVQPDQGTVTLNGRVIVETVPAPPGATVRVPGQGLARIYYDNGCTEVVNAYESRVVQSNPVCDTAAYGNFNYATKGPFLLVATGGVLGVIIYNTTNDDNPVSP